MLHTVFLKPADFAQLMGNILAWMVSWPYVSHTLFLSLNLLRLKKKEGKITINQCHRSVRKVRLIPKPPPQSCCALRTLLPVGKNLMMKLLYNDAFKHTDLRLRLVAHQTLGDIFLWSSSFTLDAEATPDAASPPAPRAAPSPSVAAYFWAWKTIFQLILMSLKHNSAAVAEKAECSYSIKNTDCSQRASTFLLKHTHVWKRSRAKLSNASRLWTPRCAVDSDTTVPLWRREADSLCRTCVDILQGQQRCYSLFNRLSHTITQRTTRNNITHTSLEIKTGQDKALMWTHGHDHV